jgi:hypothetical protein
MKRIDTETATAAGSEGFTPADGTRDSHGRAAKPRRKQAIFDAIALQQKLFWTVPETAFICRVGARTVWRELSDPKSKFPRPRRIRGRTLLARDEVLAYLATEAAR